MPLFGPPDVAKLKGKGDVKGLINALEDPASRAAATAALGEIRDPRAIQPLGVILALGDRKASRAAAAALGEIRDPRAVGALENALTHYSDEDVRAAAAEALGRISDPRAVESLVFALKNPSLGAQKAAAEALVNIGAPAVESLIATLQDPNLSARKAAADSLGRISDPRAVEPFIAALQNRDLGVRTAASEALDGLGWSPDGGEAGAAYWAAKGKWKKCVEVGASAVRPLITALSGGNWKTRKAVANGLVTLYRSGKLDDAQKATLLAQREVITRSHVDGTDSLDRCDFFEERHTDEGIGVEFPG